MNFDGIDDYANCGAANELDVSVSNNLYNWNNLLTLSAWIKPYSFNNNQRIISHSFASTVNQQYSLAVSGDKIYFLSTNGAFEQGILNISNTSLSLNQWNHVAMTYDGYAVRLYLNGTLDFEHFVSEQFPSGDQGDLAIDIAQRNDGQEKFHGLIDDVSIWNIALSENLINQYMNCPPSSTIPSLIGYWNFDEGTGNTNFDISHGSHATIGGSPSFNTNVPSQSCQLINSNGCDSTAILNLTINNSVSTSNTVSICSGDSFTVGTFPYTLDGTYTDILIKTDGCDSTVTTILTIDPLGMYRSFSL